MMLKFFLLTLLAIISWYLYSLWNIPPVLLELKINNLKSCSTYLDSVDQESLYDLHVLYYSRKNEMDIEDLNIFKKIFNTVPINNLDLQDLNNYKDENFFIFSGLNSDYIESIRIVFDNIEENQWLEKTLYVLKEKINSSKKKTKLKRLSIDIWSYRLSNKEIEIISQMKIIRFWYNDDEKSNLKDLRYSKSDQIIKRILSNSPYLVDILYWDYRWFKKKDWKIVYYVD